MLGGSGAPERLQGCRSCPASRPVPVPASPPSPPRRRPPPAAASQAGGPAHVPPPPAVTGRAATVFGAAGVSRPPAARSARHPRSGPAAPAPRGRRGCPPRCGPAPFPDLPSVCLLARGGGRQRLGQLDPQGRERPEDVPADSALGAAHDLSDLRVGKPLVVAEHQRRALPP